MKIETAASVAAGGGMSIGAILAQHGATPVSVGLALFGAAIAVLEMENRRLRTVLSVLLLNTSLGILGAPVIVQKLGLHHPAALAFVALLVGYVGHEAILDLKRRIGKK